MGLWKDFLRLLGLTSDARVHISAPGIDVVITGEPEQVRALLGAVKYELERSTRWRDRQDPKRLGNGETKRVSAVGSSVSVGPAGKVPASAGSSQYVQPTELDEMDSPYALPDPVVMPVDEITGERERQPTSRKASEDPSAARAQFVTESATLVPDSNPPPSLSDSQDSQDREITAVQPNPSGPHPAQSGAPAILKSSNPFITDGGPTLTPSLNDSDTSDLADAAERGSRIGREPARADDAEDTKDTPRR